MKNKHNMKKATSTLACLMSLFPNLGIAREDHDAEASDLVHIHTEACDDHGTGLVIEPLIFFSGVFGNTDLEDAGLDTGGHDPSVNGFSIPTLSVATDITYGKHLAAYVEGVGFWDSDEGSDVELEELYFKIKDLPGGFSIKAGQFLTATGTLNTVHSHAWNFVDIQLGNVRFLGDDGLIIEGTELAWSPPTSWEDRISVSFGNAIEHDHEEEEEEEGEEHGHEEDEHGHNEEAEQALWNESILSLRYTAAITGRNHQDYVYGLSYIQGDNFFGETGRLYGADFTYRWHDPAHTGKKFIWSNEFMYRDVDTDEGNFDEFAFTSTAVYSFNEEWQVGLRYDYLEGVDDPELPERHRISPALTRYYKLGSVHSFARAQYNYDDSEERGEDHSFWLQFGFEWGSKDNHSH